MDYAVPDRRKSKNDKRAKRRFRVYKHGGKFRTNEKENLSFAELTWHLEKTKEEIILLHK